MRYLNIIVLLVAALLTGCSDKEEGSLRIDSLSVDGNEFYCFQKVKMWVCVESDNLGIADYQWGCDGGHFSEGQGISEACWIPPGNPGEYQVWCKVTIGKNTETRYRKMNVSHYFFDYFENGTATGLNITSAMRSRPLTWAVATGLTATVTPATTSCELKLSSNTAVSSSYIRSFNDPDLKMPFSCMATIGWNTNMPTKLVTVGSSSTYNSIGYRFSLSRDPSMTDAYVSAILFDWFPAGSTDNLPLDPSGSGEKCNGFFRFYYTATGTTFSSTPIWFYHPSLKFGEKEYKKVAFNVSADYIVSVYVAGTKVFETEALNTWRNENNYTGNFFLNNWAIVIPNGDGDGVNAPSKIPTFYLANTVGQNTGYVYTGVEDN